MKKCLRAGLAACTALLAIVSISPARAELIYGVASQGSGQSLITWDSAAPNSLLSSVPLTLPNAVLGIDFRPATGQLYGLVVDGSNFRLATIALNGVGTLLPAAGTPVNGFSHGFDFNPTIDRIRVVTDVNKNYVFNPITGALQLAATDLAYGAADPNFGRDPNVAGSAYTNNFLGATTTQLYGIDTGLDVLVTQNNNGGVLGTVGGLGLDVSALAGFDISGTSGVAYATMTPAGSSQSTFYTVNLATGSTSNIGVIGGGVVITAMTTAPRAIPEPAAMAMLGVSALALAAIRRRR